MKLTDTLAHLIKKKDEGKEYFFSLCVDSDSAAVAVWSIDFQKRPVIASFAHGLIREDSWDARIQVVDRLLSAAEEKVGSTAAISKTVFGLPSRYLTAEGNILDSIRPHLKKLTTMLDLSPVGFVPLTQAIANQVKVTEGVPVSIILIGYSKGQSYVTLFRVGKMISHETVDLETDPVVAVEAVLKAYQDGEVLPSRMLLYGGDASALEDIRAKLLKHPWPNRTNFLHFPKIEAVSLESLLSAVSLAGASELAATIGEAEESAEEERTDEESEQPGSITIAVAQPRPSIVDDEMEEVEEHLEEIGEEIEEEEEDESAVSEEVANVQMVTPESLGFETSGAKTLRHDDVSEEPGEIVEANEEEEVSTQKQWFAVPADLFSAVVDRAKQIRLPRGMPIPRTIVIPLIIVVVILCVITGVVYMLPSATVTVTLSPQAVSASSAVIVNPKITAIDPSTNTVPARTKSQSVTGEKTIAVTGKKNIGDPAKGSVVIYNKVTTKRTFSKGTVLTSNGVSFTLDGDVSIASASEDIGSITFGKATAAVTAKEIGPNGNLSSGSEFVFSGISASQVSARSDTAFTGGTSKQVTVVSRADQDALVKALSEELVVQAKNQLSQSASGGERLIDQTIKTAVSEKVFDQELDTQVKELHGKVTVSVSGISVSDEDIRALLQEKVERTVQTGYSLDPASVQVTVSNATLKKDGSLSLTASLSGQAVPHFDTAAVKQLLVGKSISDAASTLKTYTGVSGASFSFRLSPTDKRLPFNASNITVVTTVSK